MPWAVSTGQFVDATQHLLRCGREDIAKVVLALTQICDAEAMQARDDRGDVTLRTPGEGKEHHG